MEQKVFLGKPKHGWVELNVSDGEMSFSCFASDLSDIPFDVCGAAEESLLHQTTFSIPLELESEGDALLVSDIHETHLFHYTDETKLYYFSIGIYSLINQLLTQLKENIDEWAVAIRKKVLLSTIHELEKLLKNHI